MTTDHWSEGYCAALLNGASYADNPQEGKPGATAWAFGCGQGMKDRNASAFDRIIETLNPAHAAN